MARRRSSRKKVVGTVVKTTKKLVKETVELSVEADGVKQAGPTVEAVLQQAASSPEKKRVEIIVHDNKAQQNHAKKTAVETAVQEKGAEPNGAQERPAKAHNKGTKKMKKRFSGGHYTEISGNYKRFVYKVLKQVHPDLGVSSKAMAIIDSMMNDMFERLAEEAARLSKYTERVTLSSREIQTAVRLVLPGELGKHAISEGAKAVANYVTATTSST